jgi:hypothetical protein
MFFLGSVANAMTCDRGCRGLHRLRGNREDRTLGSCACSVVMRGRGRNGEPRPGAFAARFSIFQVFCFAFVVHGARKASTTPSAKSGPPPVTRSIRRKPASAGCEYSAPPAWASRNASRARAMTHARTMPGRTTKLRSHANRASSRAESGGSIRRVSSSITGRHSFSEGAQLRPPRRAQKGFPASAAAGARRRPETQYRNGTASAVVSDRTCARLAAGRGNRRGQDPRVRSRAQRAVAEFARNSPTPFHTPQAVRRRGCFLARTVQVAG